MTKPQIATIVGIQQVCADVYTNMSDPVAAKADCERRLALMKEAMSTLHGTHLKTPMLLTSVQAQVLAIGN